MSQRQQIERIMEIDRRIRSGEFPNAASIAKTLAVGKRVIYNDREFMINRLGAPIEFDQGHGGWYYTDQAWVLPNIMVTEGELLAFMLSAEIARRYLGTSLEDSLRSAVEKITRIMKGPVSIDLEALKVNYTFAAPALAHAEEATLMAVHDAIKGRRRMLLHYFTLSRNEQTERTVSPYHLYYVGGEWYLIAYDDLRSDFRNFAVSRINEFAVLPERYKVDPGFSVTKWMENAFQAERGNEPVEVAIKFDEQQARYIRERRWHSTQQIEEQAGGGLILKFQTGGLGAVKRWVLQYGAHAEVLSPRELRDDCRSEIECMERIYRGE